MVTNEHLISDIIADYLIEKDIKVVFGIIGSSNSYIFDSINNKGFTKIVYMHHEQAVVMAAGAYYRTCGKVSAAIVTAGGGAINALTGVLSNWADSIPCIVLAGQESTKYINEHSRLRMLGTQGFNASSMVSDITKYSATITNKDEVLHCLDKAYYHALNNRPGPTWLDIPFDIQSSKVVKADLIRYNPNEDTNTSNIDELVNLINNSKRPVILGGHGIKLSNSQKKFKDLVNKLKIPTLLSWSGLDLLPYDHEYNFGCSGLYGQRRANFVVQNCDLLVVLGSRLALPQTGYNINNFAPNAKIVVINNDEEELKKHTRYDLTINADCKVIIDQLSECDINAYREDWHNQCKQYAEDFPLIEQAHLLDNAQYDNSYVLINSLSKILKEDTVVVVGQGTPLPCGHQALEVKKGQTVFASNGLGEMGHGLPSAVGAALASGNRDVILLDGDGSMMMNLQELQTIVGYKLPVKIIVFNNEGYLFIKHTQKMLFNGRYTGVDDATGVSIPQFKKIAKAFDITYFSSKLNTLSDFVEHSGSCIYECFMNPEQDLIPKVKGIPVVDGILAPPLEEMSPLLPIEVVERSMITNVNELSYKIRQ
jgi:acetolactate synthase I/II/III large subunit